MGYSLCNCIDVQFREIIESRSQFLFNKPEPKHKYTDKIKRNSKTKQRNTILLIFGVVDKLINCQPQPNGRNYNQIHKKQLMQFGKGHFLPQFLTNDNNMHKQYETINTETN